MANYFQQARTSPVLRRDDERTTVAARTGGGVVMLGGGSNGRPLAYNTPGMANPLTMKMREEPSRHFATPPLATTPPPAPTQTPATPPPPETTAPPADPTTPPANTPPPGTTTPVTPRTPVAPPPPVTPNGGLYRSGEMADALWRQAQGAMADPSRYNADVVRQAAGVIEESIKRMRSEGMRSLGEHHAGRGLIGSSLESADVVSLNSQLDEHARAQLSNLQREQANTYGADRNAAFGMGIGAQGSREQFEGRYGNEGYRDRALAQQRYFGDQDVGYRDRALDQERWRAEQGYERQDRGLDQNEVGLYADLAERYGPEVLERWGIVPPGGATTGQRPDPNGFWDGTYRPSRRNEYFAN